MTHCDTTNHRRAGARVSHLALCAMLSLGGAYLGSPTTALAQAGTETAQDFAIAAQPLAAALLEFSDRTGLQVFADQRLVRGHRSARVEGEMTPQAALTRLLAPSGLSYRASGDKVVAIVDPRVGLPGGQNEAGLLLPPIQVTLPQGGTGGRGFQGASDSIYETAASVSEVTRDTMTSARVRHANDLLDDVAGVYTADNPQDPGLNINLRGLQDQSRIATSIDGVRQNFQLSGHGSTGYVYLDPSMFRAAQVEKTVTAGPGGAASLGGQVDFRTLGAEDLIAEGAAQGGQVIAATGSNGYDFAGSAFWAKRLSDQIAVTAGISRRKLGDYDIGHDGDIDGYFGPISEPADYTSSETLSGLAKVELTPDEDQTLTLSWLGFSGDYSTGTGQYIDTNETTNHTLRAGYSYDPASPLLDLNADLWANRTRVDQYRPPRTNYGAFDVSYEMMSYGASVDNTSALVLAGRPLSLRYGVEAFQDNTETRSTGSDPTDDPQGAWYAGTMPDGTREVASAFASADYQLSERFGLHLGLRRDSYDLSGTALIYDEGTQDYSEEQIESSGARWLPSAQLTFEPGPNLDLWLSYSEGYRPPAIMEVAASGTHIGSGGQFYIPNPALRPETSRTWEIGANYTRDDALRPGDSLRLKAVVFSREVEDYVSLWYNSDFRFTNMNSNGTSTFDGIELEAAYDAGRFFIGGTYSWMDADIDTSYSLTQVIAGMEFTYDMDGGLFVYMPPEQKATLEAGMRLLDDRLTLGTRATWASDSVYGGAAGYQSDVSGFTVYDLFGSYALSDSAMVNFGVENVTDLAYADVLGNPNYGTPGRTFTVSLDTRF
ncbi:Hemin receptor precursor [Pseudooceanicola marinus]|uniref:Hemin receptor n=1 Tax=Pseudooceanicola marinus TaxID=396013 RepID=A0A1X6Y7T0_9RHOB|nr:TonB-dependent receptor [Pseudooceanicola marinus]SLN13264.1 Hemin receptor precursor [Pseudooceanicola marinus]